jgi:RNA polymerase sigma-70 factor (ECF subfamily)
MQERNRQGQFFAGEQAFTAFYREHAESLLIWFARQTLDTEAALDLTSETFAQAFLGRRRFKGHDAGLAGGWLYGIARHQLSRYWRRGQAESRAMRRLGLEREELAPSEQERLEERAQIDELRDRVGEALAALPDAQRAAVEMRVVRGASYAEVGAALGISEATARARVSRGLRALALQLELENEPTPTKEEPAWT